MEQVRDTDAGQADEGKVAVDHIIGHRSQFPHTPGPPEPPWVVHAHLGFEKPERLK